MELQGYNATIPEDIEHDMTDVLRGIIRGIISV